MRGEVRQAGHAATHHVAEKSMTTTLPSLSLNSLSSSKDVGCATASPAPPRATTLTARSASGDGRAETHASRDATRNASIFDSRGGGSTTLADDGFKDRARRRVSRSDFRTSRGRPGGGRRARGAATSSLASAAPRRVRARSDSLRGVARRLGGPPRRRGARCRRRGRTCRGAWRGRRGGSGRGTP